MHPEVDHGGLLEFSVVYTDRALNHMSSNFQHVMKDHALRDYFIKRRQELANGSKNDNDENSNSSSPHLQESKNQSVDPNHSISLPT